MSDGAVEEQMSRAVNIVNIVKDGDYCASQTSEECVESTHCCSPPNSYSVHLGTGDMTDINFP